MANCIFSVPNRPKASIARPTKSWVISKIEMAYVGPSKVKLIIIL